MLINIRFNLMLEYGLVFKLYFELEYGLRIESYFSVKLEWMLKDIIRSLNIISFLILVLMFNKFY
jgi:hypothetical protein